MKYEKFSEPLASPFVFTRRILTHFGVALLMILAALAFGMLIFHYAEHKEWTNSFAHAAMIVSGMGPLAEIKHPMAPILAGLYAMIVGLLLVGIIAIILAPFLHRFIHYYHLSN